MESISYSQFTTKKECPYIHSHSTHTPLLAPSIVALSAQGRVPFRLRCQSSHPNLCYLQLAFNSWVSVSVSLFAKVAENSISAHLFNHLRPLCPPPPSSTSSLHLSCVVCLYSDLLIKQIIKSDSVHFSVILNTLQHALCLRPSLDKQTVSWKWICQWFGSFLKQLCETFLSFHREDLMCCFINKMIHPLIKKIWFHLMVYLLNGQKLLFHVWFDCLRMLEKHS